MKRLSEEELRQLNVYYGEMCSRAAAEIRALREVERAAREYAFRNNVEQAEVWDLLQALSKLPEVPPA